MVNLHFSLLPRWRGAAPVERALLAGDTETGVCLMQLEEGLDTGPIYDTVRVPIMPTVTADQLRQELVAVGTTQLVRCLAAPLGNPVPQRGQPLYAAKIRPEELRIDWSQPAEQIDRVVRVGGAWATFRGKRVKVIAAVVDEAGSGVLERPVAGLRLLVVQPEGKGPMALADFVRGVRPEPGERFE
jgi:methionyl-tRNA formyltransferase